MKFEDTQHILEMLYKLGVAHRYIIQVKKMYPLSDYPRRPTTYYVVNL